MQLVCNGVALDMYANTNLQLKHENPLFAFDNLKCERTTNFKLPATPTNDRVFELAKIPAYRGEGMRRRFNAQLQAGTVVKDGYLYVSSFDGKDYNATFVTGELVGLQKIKDLGKIKDIMTYTDTVQVGSGLQYGYAARQNEARWANIRYAKPIAPLVRPSVCLSKIYNDIIAQEGLTAQSLPEQAQQLWLISAMKAIEQSVIFSVRVLDPSQPSVAPTNSYNSATSDVTIFETEETQYGIVINAQDGSTPNQFFNVVQFKAKTDIVLEIPDNWEETMYIFDLSLTHDDETSGHFYGGRYFTDGGIFDTETHIYPQGEQLAGRSVQIAAGECFSFVDSRYYQNFRIDIMGQYRYNSGFFLQETGEADFASDYNLTVKTDGDLKNGDICRLQDNLPDITFVELLKVFAAVSGRVLAYDDTRGIYFDEVNFSDWETKELGSITKRGEVKRSFADYVKQNIIDYKTEDGILFPISTAYTIDNDNLEDEKTLMTIPFSEGEQNKDYPTQVYIGAQSEEPTLASDAGEDVLLQRVPLPKNANIQNLCDASTQIKIDAHMPLLTYDGIKPDTALLVDNLQYLWTARSWQKDTAQFTLARFIKPEQPQPVPTYIQDGLVFWLDGTDKRAEGNYAWVDKIGGIGFTKGENVTEIANGFSFDGSRTSIMNGSALLNVVANECTIEVVFYSKLTNAWAPIFVGNTWENISQYLGLVMDTRNIIPYPAIKFGTRTESGSLRFYRVYNNRLITVSSSLFNPIFVNKEEITDYSTIQGEATIFSNRGTSRIGGRIDGSNIVTFNGEIYAIRVYNRILTREEVLNNQTIDAELYGIT